MAPPAWRPRATRAAILLACAAVALAASSAAQSGGLGGVLEERQTRCYDCHRAFDPPARDGFYAILPPAEVAVPAGGGATAYTVRIQNIYTSDLLYLEPSLDLTNAPGLAFASDQEPIAGALDETIAIDPERATEPQRAFVPLEVPEGATSLAITLTPDEADGTTGPDLKLRVYPGLAQPSGKPAVTVDEAGRGGAETFTVDGAAGFRGLGYGNWTVEAEVRLVDPDNMTLTPIVGDVGFSVDFDIRFDASAERVQYIPRTKTIKPQESDLFTWRLVAVPGAGEPATIPVTAVAQVYWKHQPSSNAIDLQNMTKAVTEPLEVEPTPDGGWAITSTVAGPTPQAGPVLGVSMARISEAIGYVATFLIVFSIWSGGMFGKASRRQLNHLFTTAKQRVAFHNFLSYGLMAFAAAHTVVFFVENSYHWAWGLIWGGLAILAMGLLGVTGALQVPMVRRWNYPLWRWTHYGLAVAAIAFALVHILLDGANFGQVSETVGWNDPLVPDTRG